MQHPDFSLKNPNRARSLIFSYCSANPGAFHRRDAAGYVFWSERVIELDAINPQVAARLARAWTAGRNWPSPGAAPPVKPSPAWPPRTPEQRRARGRHPRTGRR
jgi:aminopeptidase N